MSRDPEHAAGSESDAAGATADSRLSTGDLHDTARLLQAEKQRLYEEIQNYPTPIAGCDQQFNYLLEQQAQVIAELRRVSAGLANAAGARDDA